MAEITGELISQQNPTVLNGTEQVLLEKENKNYKTTLADVKEFAKKGLKTSELTNDSHFVADPSYQHTDNNFTTEEKQKLAGMAESGTAPVIGENGNWWINGVDTGKPSKGADGLPGKPGADGKPGTPGANGATLEGQVLVSDTIPDGNEQDEAVPKVKAVKAKLSELENISEKRYSGFHKDEFIAKSNGLAQKFIGLGYIEIPYKRGDIIDIKKALSGSAYDKYNFYQDGSFLSSSNLLTTIPPECTSIKVNGKLSNGIFVTINGIPFTWQSAIQKNENDILDSNKRISLLEDNLINIYYSEIKKYWGNETLLEPGGARFEISFDGKKYIINSNKNGAFGTAYLNKLDQSKKYAFYIDIEFKEAPIGYKMFQFGSNKNRKDIKSSDYGYENFNGKRIKVTYKTNVLPDDNLLFLATHPTSAGEGNVQIYLHSIGVIDCGNSNENPLYSLSADEITSLLSKAQLVDNKFIGVKSREKYQHSTLDGVEFFSVGDSLAALNKWQTQLASLTGGKYDVDFHNNNAINAGGTSSMGANYTSGQVRLQRLISLKPDASVIIFENINDVKGNDISAFGKDTDAPFIVGKSTDSKVYNSAEEAGNDWKTNKLKLIQAIPSDERSLGHIYRLQYKANNGKKLSISGQPQKGDFQLSVNGYLATINIVEGDNMGKVISKIMEIAYPNVSKTTDNATYVAFTPLDGAPVVISYRNQDAVGLTLTASAFEGSAKSNKCFIGESLSEFENISKWVDINDISTWSWYKGMFDLCRTKVPNARLIWFQPTRLPIAWTPDNEKYVPSMWSNGVIKMTEWQKNEQYLKYKVLKEFQKSVCSMYSVQVADIESIANISASNVKAYYPEYNVHPLDKTYSKWASALNILVG